MHLHDVFDLVLELIQLFDLLRGIHATHFVEPNHDKYGVWLRKFPIAGTRNVVGSKVYECEYVCGWW